MTTLHKRFSVALGILGLALLSGCTDSQDSPSGQGNIRALHAVGDAGVVQFLIEAREVGSLSFHGASGFQRFDADSYDFHFDTVNGQTGEIERILSTVLSIEVDKNYTFVLTGSRAAPTLLTFIQDINDLAAGATVAQLALTNQTTSLANVDVYLGETDFDPAATTPLATLAQRAFEVVADIDAASYQIVATTAGDATDIVYRSESVTLTGGDTYLISLFDSQGESDSAYVATVAGGTGAATFDDDRTPTSAQIYHASRTTGAIDVFVNDETTPLVSNIALNEISTVVPIAAADDRASFELTTTSTGNMGAQLAEQAGSILSDARTTLLFLSGEQANNDFPLALFPAVPSRRPIADATRLTVFNAIGNVDRVDLYLLEEGDTIADTQPRLGNAIPSRLFEQTTIATGTFDAVITNAADDTVLYGPVPITLSPGDVSVLILSETADPNVADLIRFELAP